MCIKYKINEMQTYTKQHVLFFTVHSCTVTVIVKYVTKIALRASLYNLTLYYSEHENMKTKIPVQSQTQLLYVNDPLTM